MQNSWEGLLEVIEVDEDTYHVKKSHGNAVPHLVHVNRLKAYHSRDDRVNICCADGEMEACCLFELMAERQTDSTLESIDTCSALTPSERAELLSVLQEHKEVFSNNPGKTHLLTQNHYRRTTAACQQTLQSHWQGAGTNSYRNRKCVRTGSNLKSLTALGCYLWSWYLRKTTW